MTHTIRVVGIVGELLLPSFSGYDQKLIATDLTTENTIGLAIYKENFYNIWLNISAFHDVSGLVLTVTGQYYEAWLYKYSSGTLVEHFEAVGDSFTFNANQSIVVDKTKMMYETIVAPGLGEESNHGHCLVLTINFDTELVTEPNDYPVGLLFEMGFV
jgi:hypothetical protein